MAFKSGFTNQHSALWDVMAPGPLRAAAGFHYQEFTSLAEPLRLTPDPYGVGAQNRPSLWAESTGRMLIEALGGVWDTSKLPTAQSVARN
jgi:hypothetical protein